MLNGCEQGGYGYRALLALRCIAMDGDLGLSIVPVSIGKQLK